MLNYPAEAYLGFSCDYWHTSSLFIFFFENWGFEEIPTLDNWVILPTWLLPFE